MTQPDLEEFVHRIDTIESEFLHFLERNPLLVRRVGVVEAIQMLKRAAAALQRAADSPAGTAQLAHQGDDRMTRNYLLTITDADSAPNPSTLKSRIVEAARLIRDDLAARGDAAPRAELIPGPSASDPSWELTIETELPDPVVAEILHQRLRAHHLAQDA